MPLPEFVNEFSRITQVIVFVRPTVDETLVMASRRVLDAKQTANAETIIAVDMDTDEAQVVKSTALDFKRGKWLPDENRFSWEDPKSTKITLTNLLNDLLAWSTSQDRLTVNKVELGIFIKKLIEKYGLPTS